MSRRRIYRAAVPAATMQRCLVRLEAGEPAERAGAPEPGRRLLPEDREAVRRLANTCSQCLEEGHHRQQCPYLICRACGQGGHKAKRCPNGGRAG